MRSLSYLFVALLLSNAAVAATPGAPAAEKTRQAAASSDRRTFDGWHTFMNRTLPSKKGCFTATYPSTTWQEIPCAAGPRRTYERTYAPQPSRPQSVGSGIDFEAQVAGLMSSATGSFDSV